ncbi:MAG: MATE family efflux transporter [Pontiellaceae bacterium]|nr:MATE family efflux transporter [Pontiellaceae bacterium]MBN2784639.1 MATE family efflux transporter [Pontiellaceae bacterium]
MHKNETERRTFGGYRELLKIAWPLIISTGSFSLLNFCDRMFLGWYSPEAFRAAVPAGILCFTMLCGFVALAAYSNTFVAQYFGAGEYRKCAVATVQGLWLSLLAWPIMLALIPLGLFFLKISGHGPAVFEQERIYFSILMLGSVSQPFAAAISGFFSGRGETVTVMLANVLGNVINIVLDYILVFGHFGFPEMGIAGAAIASVIAGWVSPGIMLLYFLSPSTDHQFFTRKAFRWNPLQLRQMVRYGGPSGIHLFLDLASFSLFVLLLGRQGEAASIASNMALSINLFALMPMIGLSIATSIMVGQYMGARQPDFAERSGWIALKAGMFYTVPLVSTFIFFPHFYVNLFGQSSGIAASPEVFQICRQLLLVLVAWGIMDAVNFIVSGALKGAGDTHFVMYFHTGLAWTFFAIGELVLVLVLHVGPVIAWLWCLLYIIVLSLGLCWRFKSGRWKSIDILDRHTPVEEERLPVDH